MNSLLLIIILFPIIEIAVMIKIGAQIGVFNTIFFILFTAIVGIYYAKIEGLNTIKTGIQNFYKNKTPIYEIISGASIAIAAMLLMLPGFITDAFGFFLLIPLTRRILINYWMKKRNLQHQSTNKDNGIIDGEIIEKKNDKDNKNES
jgi:UPF0716 protein FxsA